MITPGYGLTATERVLPRMALDFTTASLDSRVTVTRALNTATRFNSSGYIETVNADLPRFDFNPSTLACRGLLIEEARENMLSQSNAFTTSPWQTQFTVAAAQNVTGPDNVANSAWTLTDNDATNTAYYFRAMGVANNSATYSGSVFILKTTNATTFPAVNINILGGSPIIIAAYAVNTNTGVATAMTGNAGSSSVSVQDAGAFWRVSLSTTNNSSGNTNIYFLLYPAVNTNAGPSYVGSATGSAVFYGAQLEVGAFATSYIPTTTTSLTRNADVVSMTGTNFSDWYNAAEGAFAAWFLTPDPSIGLLGDQTAASAIMYSSNLDIKTFNGSSSIIATGVFSLNTLSKAVLSYSAAGRAIALNGNTVVQDANTLQSVTRLDIGRAFISQYLNGHCVKVFFYPQRLTNAETRAFSKG